MRTLALLSILTALATPCAALERTAVPFRGHEPNWSAGATCSIAYYNICTGWVWTWTGVAAGQRIGVAYDTCGGSAGCTVTSTCVHFLSGAPYGRGLTGTISLFALDENECPTGTPLATAPHIPISGWSQYVWSDVAVPPRFASVIEFGSYHANPAVYTTDHPAAGPTGPQACGNCFSATRISNSYSWGTAASPLCPGDPFEDDVCDAELLWAVAMSCPIDVNDESWGRLKQLYR